MIRTVLRAFSYLFHGVLALFLLAISAVTLLSSPARLSLRMLPWSGDTPPGALFAGALLGLLLLLLALANKSHWPFLLWSLAVAAVLARGYVFSGYYFARDEVRVAAALLLGSWLALWGAWPSGAASRGRRR